MVLVKKINVLGVDDHAAVLEGYFSIFRTLDAFEGFKFTKATDCRSGYEVITENKDCPFDIAVLDYSMPAYPGKELFNGKDLALLLRSSMPSCSIIIMTMNKQADIIADILQKVKPEGFINKSDCNTGELRRAFRGVLDGKTFFSATIANYISHQNDTIVLEDADVRILLLLANGIEAKNLNKHIPLSQNSIEEKKRRISSLLGVDDDTELIRKAKALGYI